MTRPFRSALGGFKPEAAAFYSGCVIAAFAHIHAQGIAYRDLKPENLLIDIKGYCKVIDFGFAKKIPGPKGDLSYTICGTPMYIAPEVLTKQGHGCEADWWTQRRPRTEGVAIPAPLSRSSPPPAPPLSTGGRSASSRTSS